MHDLAITVTGTRAPEDLRALQDWLSDEPELRGRAQLVERAPEPGYLGSVPELLHVAVGSASAATAVATAVCAWLRHRTSDLSCTISSEGGSSVSVSSQRVRGSDLVAQGQFVRELAAALDTGSAPTAGAEPSEPEPENTGDA